ncbi:outer membrane protein assembly factor BamB family protein [Halorussus ruber]|uniref:outer membrane protein assembly factor BamB family protein n=1 Tax=Halorussus ruber TaxID=1126238 RepID=UPI001091F5CF|nr:PQQ-binding-like beta-propeller repeat protein [Halorussus ruber]
MSLEGSVSVQLGDCSPRGSRQQWRRSSVTALGGGEAEAETADFAVGTADGTVLALDSDGTERWRTPGEEMAVALAEDDTSLAVGTRGDRGRVRLLDSSGDERWAYDTASDLGGPAKDTLFWYPFVVDALAGEDRIYAAARRYERDSDRPDGDQRVWRSAVYAFDPDGEVRWRYETDASPIALSLEDGRLAVAYNRCGGDHDRGLVVLDAESGTPVADWDPGTAGERRVGDVSLAGGDLAAASHGDYRGYLLGEVDADGGAERWATDLGVERAVGDETLYAYPNHVLLAGDAAVFVTGNTFPEEGREAEGRHPNEHTIAAFSREEGERLWSASVGGFACEVVSSGERIAVPCAQHFRDRDAEAHGLRVFDAREGLVREIGAEGVVSSAALSDGRVAFVEEPVEYHDEGEVRGEYRVRVEQI